MNRDTLPAAARPLWDELHNAKAERLRTTDLERLSELHTQIGKLTGEIRRIVQREGQDT